MLNHPATWQPAKEHATELMAFLEENLSPEIIGAAMERGKKLRLEDVAEEILSETQARV